MYPIHHHGHELMVQDRLRRCRLEVGLISYCEDQEPLEDVAENLEYLTTVIDSLHLNDFP